MGCLKLTYYQEPELKVSYISKELTLKNSAVNERSNILIRLIDPNGMAVTETDTSIVYTGQDAVDLFNQLKGSSNSDDDQALIGVPAIAGMTAKKTVEEGAKYWVGRSLGLMLSLVFLTGDSGPDYYSPQVAEEEVNRLIGQGNLVELKEYVTEYNKRNYDKIVFRYLSAKEAFFVGKTMKINNTDQNLNLTRKYITPDLYGSASTAKSLLALPYAPNIGVWTFESEIQGSKHPQIGWDTVAPAFNEPGGGNEATIGQPFPAKGAFMLDK